MSYNRICYLSFIFSSKCRRVIPSKLLLTSIRINVPLMISNLFPSCVDLHNFQLISTQYYTNIYLNIVFTYSRLNKWKIMNVCSKWCSWLLGNLHTCKKCDYRTRWHSYTVSQRKRKLKAKLLYKYILSLETSCACACAYVIQFFSPCWADLTKLLVPGMTQPPVHL